MTTPQKQSPLDHLIQKALEEFEKEFWLHRIPKNTKQIKDIEDFLETKLREVWVAGIEDGKK